MMILNPNVDTKVFVWHLTPFIDISIIEFVLQVKTVLWKCAAIRVINVTGIAKSLAMSPCLKITHADNCMRAL